MENIQYATNRIIDSVYTIAYRLIDGKAEILEYDRHNRIAYQQEKELPQGKIIESPDGERTAIELKIAPYKCFRQNYDDAKTYEIANPQHIFSYS